MRRRLIKDSVQMSFARPPRNFTLALFLFDSRKGPSTRSLPLPFSLIQTPKPENPNPRLKAAKEPPKVKIISFFFFFFFLFTSFTFSGRNVIIVGRIAGVYKQNRRQKLAKMKNRNCCYINLHGARRYSKLFPPSFFLSLSSSSFFFPPPPPPPFLFMPNRESETSRAPRRKARDPAIYLVEEFSPAKMCVSHDACVSCGCRVRTRTS